MIELSSVVRANPLTLRPWRVHGPCRAQLCCADRGGTLVGHVGGIIRDLVRATRYDDALGLTLFRGKVYDIHTTSVYFTTAAFLPLLAASQSVGGYAEPGNVVNIASLSGITRTSQRGQFNYNASKAATIHLTLMQATEFARRGLGVRVNSLSPGYFPSVSTRYMCCGLTRHRA